MVAVDGPDEEKLTSKLPELPAPGDGEPFGDFEARCLTTLQQTPLDLRLPSCLAEEHDRLVNRFEKLKSYLNGPCLETLTQSRL